MKTCGLDVHKDSIFCAVYNGKEYSEVKEYDTTTPKIRQMGEHLRSEGVERVAMESTSTYWVPVWDILLEAGFELMLVKPVFDQADAWQEKRCKGRPMDSLSATQRHVARQHDSLACDSGITGVFPQIHKVAGAKDAILTENL